GMANTLQGSLPELGMKKVTGLFAGRDRVVGGKGRTRRNAFKNKFLPERVKARRFAEKSRERE
ncbi:oxidoreductase, partial [Pseudoclavibacter helvolus]